jgi:S-(hydroxymethyl)glutathione dehydrogenase/alcohol dehydrogenase
LLGCAIPTGFGAVWNSGQAKEGESVVVFGAGGIGLAAIAAAAARSAQPLIAVDVNPARLRLARHFGATACLDPASGDLSTQIRRLCPQGVALSIEATGRTQVMRQALQVVRSRGGTVVVVGNARHGEELAIDPRELNQGKRLLGTWGGDNDPDLDFPRYADHLSRHQLDLTPLTSNTYPLSQINDALDDLEAGCVPRPLIQLNEGLKVEH